MAETTSHKQAKGAAAGRKGQKEVSLKGGRRLDALTAGGSRATEVERSGTKIGLEKAAARLKARRSAQKVLQVPQQDMSKAVQAMKSKKVSGTVKNMAGTKRRSV